ncbi:NACHT, LRR and PYD domains-containing protein 2-like [Molossus molossus]|uniref:NACHT, LRR and PYD domains-containing protein 2-like n=1 Tax=Molossus molossus TaxID=27622 RepID=UPI0017465504|nr:NACHT, LRR and PYD domains-containing protein 2-like [Molossus molossus]
MDGSNTMEKFYSIWKRTFGCGEADDFHCTVTQGSQKFTSFSKAQILTQLRPLTVVVHGPAGVGKTTLAKKWMLDWTQDTRSESLSSTLYLSCKELRRQGPCTFAELISKQRPEVQQAGPEVLAQEQKLLFVIDGFDELRVPSGSLLHDICGDWEQQKPAPVLLGSLLMRKLLPKATLLVTTRPGALRQLRLLVDQPVFIEVEGLLEQDRREYFLQHFEEEDQALRAFEAMRGNPALLRLGSAPAVCWVVCTCLKLRMDEGADPALTCRTATSLFLRFLCGQFPPAPGRSAPQHLPAPLRALCVLAAEGVWTQTSAFDRGDLGRVGVQESDLRPFLDKNLLQVDTDCEGCYVFLHLSVQQFLAAVFYALDSGERAAGDGGRGDTEDVQALLSKEERLKNPDLTPVGHFLFGLANEERARELEATFGVRVSLGLRQELLKGLSGGHGPFSCRTDVKEAVSCLYESQEESLVKEATGHVREVSLHLQSPVDLAQSAFCFKHCGDLRRVSLRVEKGVFLENEGASEPDTWVESSNKNLSFLDVNHSFLSHSSVRILCDQITRVTCHLQKMVIKNVSPTDAYRDFCLALIGKKTLTHLTLEGSVHGDKMLLLLLCEALKHRRCNLQYLRLGSCSDLTQQWDDFFSALKINQSLQSLDLTASELQDEGVKLLCLSLRHPKCFLQRLSLENCHLTEVCCKELSSVLMVNRRLTHLCLAKNNLGDGGVRLLCEGLSYPECQLQTLVVCQCNITRRGCKHLSDLLQGGSSLTHLDLGLNPIATGLRFLCEALKKPDCNLRCLGLCGCSISPFCCEDLASALTSNQRLEALDLGQNTLGQRGTTALLEALKRSPCRLKTLRLKTCEASARTQKLLEELRDSNPTLTIDWKAGGASRPPYCDFLF